jgi:hypothetical protein
LDQAPVVRPDSGKPSFSRGGQVNRIAGEKKQGRRKSVYRRLHAQQEALGNRGRLHAISGMHHDDAYNPDEL